MKILVADDDIISRIVLESILNKACYNVTLCENGNEAISRIQQEPYDLVIADLIMPVRDGVAIMEFMKHHKLDTPIIAISAGDDNDPEDYLAYAKRFADATMAKPIKKDALLRTIENLTSKTKKRSFFK